jgi:hypothetical protein
VEKKLPYCMLTEALVEKSGVRKQLQTFHALAMKGLFDLLFLFGLSGVFAVTT